MENTLLLLLFLKFFFTTCVSKRDSGGSTECESGWELFEGKCYLDSSSSSLLEKAREKNYFDSRSECLFRNSVLLSLQSEEEETYLQHILDNELSKNDIINLQKYWLSKEENGLPFNQESKGNCSYLSIDVKSLKYYKSYEANCLMKYNYICKKQEESSKDPVEDCYSCEKRKKRSNRKDMNLYTNIVPHHPSWNSPFRTSFKAPFWDDFKADSPLRYPYHHPLDLVTFHNVRKRLKSEVPNMNLPPLLPVFRSRFNIPSSKNIYLTDSAEVDGSGEPVVMNSLPLRILEIVKEENENENEKQYIHVKGCRENDIQLNESCYHFQKELSFQEAKTICLETYNGTLSSNARVMSLFGDKIEVNHPIWADTEDCKSLSLKQASLQSKQCSDKLPSICKYKEIDKEVEYDPSVLNATEACPQGWHLKAEECYKLVTEKKSWEEAASFCAIENASILNNSEWLNETDFDFVFDTPKYASYEQLKIWFASPSLDLCYAVNLTVLKNSQKTVENFKDLCSKELFFICQKPKEFEVEGLLNIREKLRLSLKDFDNNQSVKVSTTTKQSPVESFCHEELPDVWLRFGDYCYQFYSFMKKRPNSWHESQHICAMKNAFLASIHSKEENSWIYSKISSFQDNFLWIGGKYDRTSTFSWDDGTSFDYIHWAQGEPNNLHDMEECVSIRTHDENGEWNDDHCYERAGYICKKLHSEAIPSVQPVNITLPTTTKLPTATVNVKRNGTTTTTQRSVKPTISFKSTTRKTKTTNAATIVTTTKTTTTPTTTTTTTTNLPSSKKTLLPKIVTSKPSEHVHLNYSKVIFPSAVPPVKGNGGHDGGCPETWYRMDNKCVKFHSMYLVNYFEARDYCFSLDKRGKASLVSVHSAKQLAFLFALTTSYKDIWIGLRYNSKLDGFAWEDSTEVDFVHWAQDEPTVSSFAMQDLWANFRGCVQIIINGEELGFWRDDDCSRHAGAFICQRPLDPEYEKSLLPFPKKCSVPHENFYSFGDNCYKFIDTPLIWQEAEDTCAAEGAHLVTVGNRKEMSFLWNQFSVMNVSDFWIGLKNPGFFTKNTKWNSGWLLFYTNWDSDKYNDFFKGCVSMSLSSGKWIPQYCFAKKPFVCEYSRQTLLLTDSSNAKPCPKRGGWIDFGGDYCYSAEMSKSLSWPEASHYCMKKKGHLVSINSEKEQQNIQYIVDGEEKSIWIGGTRLHDLTFGWSDSSEFEFKKWYNSEPSIYFGECVQMMNIGGHWTSNECSRRKPFICKVSKSQFPGIYESESNPLVMLDNPALMDLNQNAQNEPEDENSNGGIGGVAIGGILMFILIVLGSGFLAGFFLIKKRQVQNSPPTTFYGFDNVIYNADTITVAGQQIVCAPEERECILDDDEDSEDQKYSLTKSKSSENILLSHH